MAETTSNRWTDAPVSTSQMIAKKKHSTLYYEGDAAAVAYRVKEGAVILTKQDSVGNLHGFGIIRPGEIFGEESIMGLARQHCASVLNDDAKVEVLYNVKIAEVLTHAYRRSTILQEMVLLSAPNRLRLMLVTYTGITLRVVDIAACAWLTREEASRLLKKAFEAPKINSPFPRITRTKLGYGQYIFEINKEA